MGVLYFELKILSIEDNPTSQFRFALINSVDNTDEHTGQGVGDNDKSWGLDGVRVMKWHNEESYDWDCNWEVGDVIGLAANMETGMIATSKGGNWELEGSCGVAFEHDSIKAGVYPCITGSDCEVRYSFKEDVRYGPPATSVWDAAHIENPNQM